MYAEFTDDLITGNEMIDSQHRELISRINDLLVSCENRSNQSGAARLLNYLADYTDFHFKEEEAFQKEIGYPGLKEHLESMRSCAVLYRSFTICLQTKKALLTPLFPRWQKM